MFVTPRASGVCRSKSKVGLSTFDKSDSFGHLLWFCVLNGDKEHILWSGFAFFDRIAWKPLRN